MTQDSNPMPMGELSLKERALLLIADENEFKGNKLYYHREREMTMGCYHTSPKSFFIRWFNNIGDYS